jgi:heptosyltransferase I
MQDRREPLPVTRGLDHAGRRGGRFLIVRLSALGDVLHALPAAVALRRERPGARIDWIVEDRFASILEGQPAVDRVHVVPRTAWRRAIRRPWSWPGLALAFVRFVGTLWGCRYDTAIDLQGNGKSGLWSLFSGAPTRVGFRTDDVREGNGLLTNRHVRVPAAAVHRVERALAVAAAVLGRSSVACVPAPVPRSKEDRAWVDQALARHGLPARGFTVVHPGTSGFGSFKRWPPERFGRFARRMSEDGTPTVVTVGPSEEALGAEVSRASAATAIVLAPPSLNALAELVSRARLFVSADTGPLHVAAAEGVRVVALFGPKDASVYGPYGLGAQDHRASAGVVVTSEDVPCRPCSLRRCPDPVCMTSIGIETVVAQARRVLASV